MDADRSPFDRLRYRLAPRLYLSYTDTNCEYLTHTDVVSATYVAHYPPGFPVLVPGQRFSTQILTFITNLDTKEIHGYKPDYGYRVYTDKAIEITQTTNQQHNGYRSDRPLAAGR